MNETLDGGVIYGIMRVSRDTFLNIIDHIKTDIQNQTLTEEPISPEMRLGICLFRLGRGDYYYTIAELTGLGVATVCLIVLEVSNAITNNLWKDSVEHLFPADEQAMLEKILDMEQEWQFPNAFAALDGCHVPIKCPPGSPQAQKEHHNFKNFYSIVVMALVDAKYRFIWASSGWTGNTHDSTILQGTRLFTEIEAGSTILFTTKIGDVEVGPLILGDGSQMQCSPKRRGTLTIG